jgi:hypothetical protein
MRLLLSNLAARSAAKDWSAERASKRMANRVVTRLRELGFNEGQNIAIEYRNLDDPRGPFVAAADLMLCQLNLQGDHARDVAPRPR